MDRYVVVRLDDPVDADHPYYGCLNPQPDSYPGRALVFEVAGDASTDAGKRQLINQAQAQARQRNIPFVNNLDPE